MTPPPAFHLLPGVCADLSQWKRNRPKGNFGRSALWNKKIGRWWMVSSKGKQVINAIQASPLNTNLLRTAPPPASLYLLVTFGLSRSSYLIHLFISSAELQTHGTQSWQLRQRERVWPLTKREVINGRFVVPSLERLHSIERPWIVFFGARTPAESESVLLIVNTTHDVWCKTIIWTVFQNSSGRNYPEGGEWMFTSL